MSADMAATTGRDAATCRDCSQPSTLNPGPQQPIRLPYKLQLLAEAAILDQVEFRCDLADVNPLRHLAAACCLDPSEH